MSVTKDSKTGKWMSQIRIKDWTGKEIHKKKRGFSTKKEALQWEKEFIEQSNGSVGMLFKDFVNIYLKDMSHRLKPSTIANKRYMIDTKIILYFGMMTLNAIKPTDVRHWQNELTSYRDENDQPYSQTYLRTVSNQITAIFNYAVKYYGLRENPCHKAGGMGKKHADEMLFWTKEEFQTFIDCMKHKTTSYTIFMTLYYTGIRIGELLALTPADIDLNKKTLTINKSYQRLNCKDIISSPKTPKSNRVITMPTALCDCLKDYISKLYEIDDDHRLFPVSKNFVEREIKRGCDDSGVKKIRIHDIRHSHTSLLVELGFSPLLIAERLGHERVQTTMDTYSHLYPNKQIEVANQLDSLISNELATKNP